MSRRLKACDSAHRCVSLMFQDALVNRQLKASKRIVKYMSVCLFIQAYSMIKNLSLFPQPISSPLDLWADKACCTMRF